MAKLASQKITITLNKAVPNSADDTISILEDDVIEQLSEIIKELINDTSVVVEIES